MNTPRVNLKKRIRRRRAETGETHAEARLHVLTELPAAAYRPGDHVVGESGGEKLFGVVYGPGPLTSNPLTPADHVAVRWSGETYAPGESHAVPADLLRLWPAAAHNAREAEGDAT